MKPLPIRRRSRSLEYDAHALELQTTKVPITKGVSFAALKSCNLYSALLHSKRSARDEPIVSLLSCNAAGMSRRETLDAQYSCCQEVNYLFWREYLVKMVFHFWAARVYKVMAGSTPSSDNLVY